MTFCGNNNSTSSMTFRTNYTGIFSASCSVLLYGCHDGYEIQEANSENQCATCVPKSLSGTQLAIIGLVGIIVTLLIILLVLLGSFFGWRYWSVYYYILT